MINCANNYGPYQFPEKLIPLMIINALEGKPVPKETFEISLRRTVECYLADLGWWDGVYRGKRLGKA